MYKLEYLPIARKDMLDIVRYISQDLKNPDAAKRLMSLPNIVPEQGYALAPAFAANIHIIPVPAPTSSTILSLNKCLLFIIAFRYVSVRTLSFSISYSFVSSKINILHEY